MQIVSTIHTDERQFLIDTFLKNREAVEEAERRLEESKGALLDYMRAHEQKTMQLDDGEVVHKITYTQASKFTYDEAGLRRALGAKTYDAFTKKTLDKPRLRKAILDGEIDAVTAAKYIEVDENQPFIKYTLTKKSNEEWERRHGEG